MKRDTSTVFDSPYVALTFILGVALTVQLALYFF